MTSTKEARRKRVKKELQSANQITSINSFKNQDKRETNVYKYLENSVINVCDK
jgi:hypothetical protein